MGSLHVFHDSSVVSCANSRTIELVLSEGGTVPQNRFSDSLGFNVAGENVIVKFFGEGHTVDNVIGYIPSEQVLFGGCLIKSLNASKGNLDDANVNAWSATVSNIKREHHEVKYVIPGHGQLGGIDLLDYTIELFNVDQSDIGK